MIRIANHIINLEDIFHVEYFTDPSKAVVDIAKNGVMRTVTFLDGDADYIMSVLDIKHFSTINKLRQEQEEQN